MNVGNACRFDGAVSVPQSLPSLLRQNAQVFSDVLMSPSWTHIGPLGETLRGKRIPAAGCRSTRQNKSERWKELKQITWMEEKEWFRTQGEEESYETKKRIKTIHAMCESLSSPGAFCATYHTDDKALKLPAYFWPQVSPKGHGYDWRHPENCHLTVTQCSRRSTSALLCWRPTQRRRWTRRNIRTYL